MPMMPTREVDLALKDCRTLKTVAPPHCSGAAYSGSIDLGMAKRKASFQIDWVAKDP